MKNNLKNYICINGNKTELTKEQLKQLGIIAENCYLSDDGKVAHIGDYEFIVIKRDEKIGTVELLLKETLEDKIFGETNDFRESEIKEFLEDFAEKISKIIGEENLVEHIVDLTADDGLKCYGAIKSKMSLMTAQMARENVEILDEFNPKKWWWLVTPFSTPKREDSTWVKCVSPRGIIHYDISNFNNYGVRPFCIVKSSIFVS